MKSDEIKKAALKYFTMHGYEGASLSLIAEEVGMKKQSLYAHFKGKEDLFLQVLHDAKEAYMSSKIRYFSGIDSRGPENFLYEYLQLEIELFQKNEQLSFWLRMSFFPPVHVAHVVEKEVIDLIDKERAIMENKFQEWIDDKIIVGDAAKTPALAFEGVVDSILLELVYGNDEQRLKDKLEASWNVFWRGISHQ